jgi:serine protease Do
MDENIDATQAAETKAAKMPAAPIVPRWRRHFHTIALAALVGASVGALAALMVKSSTAHSRLSSVAAHLGAMSRPAKPSTSIASPRASPASFADIVDTVKPAVVGVQARLDDDIAKGSDDQRAPTRRSLRPGRQMTAQGSGFFISADGYAVTNNHVVEGTGSIQVQTDDKKTYGAKVVGTDPMTDLALIKVDGRNDFAHVALADAPPRVGDWVLAIGNPFGLGGTVTAGIVSARERDIGADSNDHLIQIDAPINKGDSGGPSFDVAGSVVGVNTMIFSPSGGSIGIAFAIPADTVRTVIPQLRSTGAVTRGWLGVEAQPVTSEIADGLGLKEARGALVVEAQADSPAAKAGIAASDVIASVDGTAIQDARDLSKRIGNTAPGTSVKVRLLHQGEKATIEEKTITVTLGRIPVKREASSGPGGGAPSGPPSNNRDAAGAPGAGATDDSVDRPNDGPVDLGLKLAPAGSIPGTRPQGVIITGVDPTGLAADQGFELGDFILDVGGKSVTTPDDVQNGLSDARRNGRHTVLVRLKSGDTTRFVAIPTG